MKNFIYIKNFIIWASNNVKNNNNGNVFLIVSVFCGNIVVTYYGRNERHVKTTYKKQVTLRLIRFWKHVKFCNQSNFILKSILTVSLPGYKPKLTCMMRNRFHFFKN